MFSFCSYMPWATAVAYPRPAMIYYVAMPFLPTDHGLAPGQAMECPTESSAIRRAEAMSCHEPNVGAIAFSRSGDPNLGEFEDAVILQAFGEVPDDFGYG